ncbi:DUF1360 domain-containing protein [Streptomyces sp. NPDC092359]|uniref:DUF1360 domain-containing protein n=1 Tax=Streptomyces sp. NPDC092359 TaxID=3366014 RepID=UPI0038129887
MITLPELALLGFAGYRATQLAAHATILDPVRKRVFAWRERKEDSGVRNAVVSLTSCVYCMGWWISGALLLVYLVITDQFAGLPLLLHGLEWFAVAGAAVFINRLDDTMGRLG